MNWTRAADLKSQLQRLWDRGEILSSIVSGETYFPRRLQFKTPAAREMVDHYDEVRRWVSEIKDLPNCRIIATERKHQVLGKNAVPGEVWIDSIDDLASWLGKKREINRFRSVVDRTRDQHPELLPWLQRKPMLALSHADRWQELLSVVSWVAQHPHPGIYIRQIDLAGVHTKFIEENRSLLSELLDIVLPTDAVNREFGGTSQFAARYGFKEKPARIRFRLLDSAPSLAFDENQDITLDATSFSRLNPSIQNVFVTENEINFLAFPHVPNSMVIFGAGYGFEALSAASWMLHCNVYYWGDIDAHGFVILHSLRVHFPHMRSIMMDEPTLLRFRHLRTDELDPSPAETLDTLTGEEAAVFSGLKRGTWGDNFRLEQERIDWHYACDIINAVSNQHASTDGAPPLHLTCADLTAYLRPSQCELRVWLRNHSRPTDDEPFHDFIQIQREQLVAKQRDCLAPGVDLSRLSEADRVVATAAAIADRVQIIFKPLLSVACSLAGMNVQISGEADFLILEDDQYVVRNVTLTHRSDAIKHPEVWLRLQLFAWLIRRASAAAPGRLELFNGRGELQIVPDDLGRNSLRALCTMLTAKCRPNPPYEPVGWTKCTGCSFRTHCFTKAESSHDVAMLSSVDQATARALHRVGAGTIKDLMEKFDEPGLEKLQISTDGRASRVGKRSSAILAAAKATASKQPLWLQAPPLPDAPNYIIYDFEGLPPYLEADALVFLWGMQIFGETVEEYQFSIAEDQSQDQQAWLLFLQQAESVFAVHGDIPFIHWHHYETGMLHRYAEKHGDRNGTASRILQNSLDLLQLLRSSVVLPIPSYSLKVIERYVGYTRRLQERDGSWAMSRYLAAVNSKDESTRQELLAEIKIYNSDDLLATNSVLDWMKCYRYAAGT